MSHEALPQRIQDAVKITRKLGIQYLWLDALCIIQGDTLDKTLEINGMGAIYKNATVTIAAASCDSVYDGFLATRSMLDGSKLAAAPPLIGSSIQRETIHGGVSSVPPRPLIFGFFPYN
jgi:hypothetical protein